MSVATPASGVFSPRWFAVLLLSGSLVFTVSCTKREEHPNFSGTWRLQSATGDVPATLMQEVTTTWNVTHKDPELTVHITTEAKDGRLTDSEQFRTDGKETTNTDMPGGSRSSGWWEGRALLMTTRISGSPSPITTSWSISEDGQKLVVRISPPGGLSRILVFSRQ